MKDLNWLLDIPQTVVAEVKDKSPFGFENPYSRLKQFEICEKYGDIISIHTDSRWGGSLDWLKIAKQLTTKPILAKGFHEGSWVSHLLNYTSTDYVLTVDDNPNLITRTQLRHEKHEKIWQEFTTLKNLENSKASVTVWNKRNPLTGEYKKETIQEVREIFKGKLCQASGIKGPEDIGDVDYILIGEGLYL